MATSLAEIRAKLQAQDNRSTGNSTFSGDNIIYPHWNIAEGTSARIRFLPNGNSKSDFFWEERLQINLTFAGIKGDTTSKPVTVKVPCVEMYGDQCPILAEVRTWFKDPGLEEMGRKYWKKKSYLFSGFVRENPIADDKTSADTIRRFIISPQIFNLIKSALLDPELENLPTDYTGGLDFTVSKTQKGGYADYSTSKWSRKESALTEDEQAKVAEQGLYNMADFLPKKPTAAELDIIKEMFEASVDGQPYDTARWGAYYRPYGVSAPEGTTSASTATPTPAPAPASAPASAPVAEKADVPFEADNVDEDSTPEATAPVQTSAPSGPRAEDILAQIRNRQKSV